MGLLVFQETLDKERLWRDSQKIVGLPCFGTRVGGGQALAATCCWKNITLCEWNCCELGATMKTGL